MSHDLAGHGAHYLTVVWIVACAFGVAALIGLAGLYRRAHARHELEEAERVIGDDAQS